MSTSVFFFMLIEELVAVRPAFHSSRIKKSNEIKSLVVKEPSGVWKPKPRSLLRYEIYEYVGTFGLATMRTQLQTANAEGCGWYLGALSSIWEPSKR